jgi:hypothetical protein
MESAPVQKQIYAFAGSELVLLSLSGYPVRPAHLSYLLPPQVQVSQHGFFLRFFFVHQSISPLIKRIEG